jgi:hypothetical protein
VVGRNMASSRFSEIEMVRKCLLLGHASTSEGRHRHEAEAKIFPSKLPENLV